MRLVQTYMYSLRRIYLLANSVFLVVTDVHVHTCMYVCSIFRMGISIILLTRPHNYTADVRIHVFK